MWKILDDKVESERIKKLRKYVSEFLSTATFDRFYYHNLIYTTIQQHQDICRDEKTDEKSNEFLLATVLLHGIGYARQYDSNEPIGAMMAEGILSLLFKHATISCFISSSVSMSLAFFVF